MNLAKAKRKHWQFVSVEEHDLQLTSTLHIYSHCVQCVPLRQFPLTIMHRPHAKSEELLTTAPHGVKTPRFPMCIHQPISPAACDISCVFSDMARHEHLHISFRAPVPFCADLCRTLPSLCGNWDSTKSLRNSARKGETCAL